ncbi:putative late blight resistance protein homolog R1B-16 [Ipomoea triloba]|uniref:putative late blight resistance protein homolog R1B-16 n=1 Tax=Ipomoea triloba TaxID=35885 RepID=UPI00125D24FA|nr:putative late blight resistance protein homolog R1B-16 [Ipomoea triloba]
MACVALTSLMATIKLEFLQSNPRVPLDDEGFISIESLYEKLSSLQAFLQEKPKSGVAIRDLEMKIRDFALDVEDRIEIQLSNFLLAKKNGEEDQQQTSQELHQTLREAAENAADLLMKVSHSIIICNEADQQVVNESQRPPIPCLKHVSANSDTPMFEVGRMVGRGRDHKLIMDQLERHPFDGLKLISIVGMTGIGKTTLAASVYNDPKIASLFQVKFWVTMSGKYNKSQMLMEILRTLVEADDEIKEGSIPDDVAAKQVYDFLSGKRYLIVLDNLWNNEAWDDIKQCFPETWIGSRIVLTTTHFRKGNNAFKYSYIHNMDLLNSEESWDLFCNNPFLEQHMAPKFKKIRSQIVEKCEGLPHSVLVVAERLSKCDNIKQEWKKVEKEIELLGVLDSKVLTFTFHQLPQHLKVCFLYFGVFPKRSAIKVKLLIRLWISEGFIEPLKHKELEDQAYEYLEELIDRSLILIDNWSLSGKVKNCRMHSALHSFCEDAEVYVSFKLLRVLAFVPSSFLQRVPARLEDLVFLRYLSVTEWFEGLDYVVSTNRNLQTLVVSSKEYELRAPTLHLPSTIWDSPRLQYLELDNSYVIDPPTVVKDNMQTLSWVCLTHCRTGVYSKFPNIKKLKLFASGSNSTIILDNLERLERLTIISVAFGCVVTLPKPSLFPSQLKKLRLDGTNLSERDLMVIARLPRLEILKLENAFHGKVWEVERGGFKQLKFLLLENKTLTQWRVGGWRVGGYSFQCLKRLVLRFCYCLEKIPRYTSNCESIELEHCCPSVIASAKWFLQFQRWRGNKNFEIKINGVKYDESECTHIEECIPSDAE